MPEVSFYLKVFRGARQDGATLLPDGALIVFQRPHDGLLVVGVAQQDLEVALGLPRQLVGEEEAEGARVGRHHGAHEAGLLLLRLQSVLVLLDHLKNTKSWTGECVWVRGECV